MCFSARVEQNIDELTRLVGAEAAWEAFADLFERRAQGDDVKVARALETNFERPANAAASRAQRAIETFHAAELAKWEEDVFLQRRRLAAAQDSLARKITKKATEDQRIATDKIAKTLRRIAEAKHTDPKPGDSRIFPMMYAPVIVREGGTSLVRPMRYTCRLAGKPASYDYRFPGTYNARRDNLGGFWRELYGRSHAVMVIHGFYENVAEHDYQHRPLAVDEKPRNVVLEFSPTPTKPMYVACLWDRWSASSGEVLDSFAAITDEPPPEVAATGHERCVIALSPENVERWLSPETLTKDELATILDAREPFYYEHRQAA